MIRKHKPELVITHLPGRAIDAPMGASHPDHLAVGEATMAACIRIQRNPGAFRSLLKEGYEPTSSKRSGFLTGRRAITWGHHPDARAENRGHQEAQKPGRQAGAGVGLREVDAQASPRGGKEGGVPLRRVVQEDQGLASSNHLSFTPCQTTVRPCCVLDIAGCRRSAEIQPATQPRRADVRDVDPCEAVAGGFLLRDGG